MDWLPLKDHVVLEHVFETTLVIPEGTTGGAKLVVHSVGPDVDNIEVGDTVLPAARQTRGAFMHEEGGKKYLICAAEDIIARKPANG